MDEVATSELSRVSLFQLWLLVPVFVPTDSSTVQSLVAVGSPCFVVLPILLAALGPGSQVVGKLGEPVVAVTAVLLVPTLFLVVVLLVVGSVFVVFPPLSPILGAMWWAAGVGASTFPPLRSV